MQKQQHQIEAYQTQLQKLTVSTIPFSVVILLIHSKQDERLQFKKQIVDMEHFLSDYGLVWVGAKHAQDNEMEEEDLHNDLVSIHDHSNGVKDDSFELDIDKLKNSIMELSIPDPWYVQVRY